MQADVSAEVIATDYEGMIREGMELAALNPHIVVKVPCIADGIKAHSLFFGKRYPNQLYTCFLGWAGIAGSKSGGYLRVSFCWQTG